MACGAGKQELDPAILCRAGLVVADSKAQNLQYGECHFAVASGGIKEDDVMELGTLSVANTPPPC